MNSQASNATLEEKWAALLNITQGSAKQETEVRNATILASAKAHVLRTQKRRKQEIWWTEKIGLATKERNKLRRTVKANRFIWIWGVQKSQISHYRH